jgi:hypothetical protein
MEDKGAQPGLIEAQLPAWAAELERLEAKAGIQLAEAKTEAPGKT